MVIIKPQKKETCRTEGETEMKSNKKTVVLLGAVLAALLVVLAAVWYLSRPAASQGNKNITVEVVHKDESRKTFTYSTEEEYLDKVLVGEGLVEDNQGEFGLFIEVVDGEKADYSVDKGYWCIEQNGERATTGAKEIPVHDGDSFALIYTIGE